MLSAALKRRVPETSYSELAVACWGDYKVGSDVVDFDEADVFDIAKDAAWEGRDDASDSQSVSSHDSLEFDDFDTVDTEEATCGRQLDACVPVGLRSPTTPEAQQQRLTSMYSAPSIEAETYAESGLVKSLSADILMFGRYALPPGPASLHSAASLPRPIAMPKQQSALERSGVLLGEAEGGPFVPPHQLNAAPEDPVQVPDSWKVRGAAALRLRTATLRQTGYLDGHTESLSSARIVRRNDTM